MSSHHLSSTGESHRNIAVLEDRIARVTTASHADVYVTVINADHQVELFCREPMQTALVTKGTCSIRVHRRTADRAPFSADIEFIKPEASLAA
jgi:hypothetical protein